MPVKPPHGANVLHQNRDPVGAIGNGRRKAEKDEYRQREERPAGRDDIERASDEPDCNEDDVASPMCQSATLGPCWGDRQRFR